MSEDHEHILDDIDLDAWSPPPIADQADAVLARMGEPGEARPAGTTSPRTSRAWVAAIAAVTALAGAAVVAATYERAPGESSSAPQAAMPSAVARSELVADRAQQLAIGGSTGELDPGAHVRWSRDGARIVVEQRAGRAAWRVSDRETLEILVPAGAGAPVASMTASGASLRVEVEMKTAGSALATTAAVVTMVVFSGHATARGAVGAPLQVAAGTSVEIGAGSAPVPRDLVARAEPSKPPANPGGAATHPPPAKPVKPAKSPGAATSAPAAPACDAEELAKRGQDHMGRGEGAAALAKFHASYQCKPSSNMANLAFLAACVSSNANMARRYYPKISNHGLAQRCRDRGVVYDEPFGTARPRSTLPRGHSTSRVGGTAQPQPMLPRGQATLRVGGQPAGMQVMIDGVVVGVAPLALKLAPGKHKVTYVIGDERYTFSVTAVAGETVTIEKDLR